MELLYVVIGAWIGMLLTYFEWYRPMAKRIKNLEEAMHDCIKAGLTNPIDDEEKE